MTYAIEFKQGDVAEIKAILGVLSDLKQAEYSGVFDWTDTNVLQITDSSGEGQILDDVEDLINILSDEKIDVRIYSMCIECNGEGSYETFNCTDSSNECCGGCYDEYPCSICEGVGMETIKSTY